MVPLANPLASANSRMENPAYPAMAINRSAAFKMAATDEAESPLAWAGVVGSATKGAERVVWVGSGMVCCPGQLLDYPGQLLDRSVGREVCKRFCSRSPPSAPRPPILGEVVDSPPQSWGARGAGGERLHGFLSNLNVATHYTEFMVILL